MLPKNQLKIDAQLQFGTDALEIITAQDLAKAAFEELMDGRKLRYLRYISSNPSYPGTIEILITAADRVGIATNGDAEWGELYGDEIHLDSGTRLTLDGRLSSSELNKRALKLVSAAKYPESERTLELYDCARELIERDHNATPADLRAAMEG